MPTKMQHIKSVKQIFLICFLLFALSPCVVKNVLLNSVSLEYSKPLNKTRSFSQNVNCQYAQSDKQELSNIDIKKINDKILFNHFSEKAVFVLRSQPFSKSYNQIFLGNSPPKYILFKRLKLDIV